MDEKATRLERVTSRWKGCRRCELAQERRNIVFWGGSHRGRLGVIGEAPGEQEDKRGKPFVGEAGALFDEMCEKVMGPEPWDLFVCNTVGCRPPKNRKPSQEEWQACRARLYGMLWAVRPRALLLLGSTALRLLTPHEKITEWRGQIIEVKIPWKSGELKFPAVPTLHPGFMLRVRDKKVERTVAHDIGTAWSLAQDGSWLEG